jgi:SNF2 family DNA or RNA helicase
MLYIRHDEGADTPHSDPDIPTKVQIIESMIAEKKTGRFLIFSSHDKTFFDLQRIFPAMLRLHGRCEQRQRSLTTFRQHEGSILFLHSIADGAGINLQEATDIILFHDMSESTETQIVGRCQRIGRQHPLFIHHFHDIYEETPST